MVPDHDAPLVLPEAAFGPISRRVIRQISGYAISADRPEDEEPPLPLFQYEDARRFPLFGIPAKVPDGEGSE